MNTKRRVVLALALSALLGSGCGKSEEGSAQASGSPSVTPSITPSPDGSASPTPAADPWLASSETVDAALAAGDYEAARTAWHELMMLAGTDVPKQAQSMKRLGQIELGQGKHGAGTAAFKETIRLAKSAPQPDYELIATCYLTVGAANFTVGRHRDAIAALERARNVMRTYKIEDTAQMKNILNGLEQVYRASGNSKAANAIIEEIRLLDLDANLPIPPEHLSVPWLARVQAPGGGSQIERWMERHQPIQWGQAETRWLNRHWPDPTLLTPTPTASPSGSASPQAAAH